MAEQAAGALTWAGRKRTIAYRYLLCGGCGPSSPFGSTAACTPSGNISSGGGRRCSSGSGEGPAVPLLNVGLEARSSVDGSRSRRPLPWLHGRRRPVLAHGVRPQPASDPLPGVTKLDGTLVQPAGRPLVARVCVSRSSGRIDRPARVRKIETSLDDAYCTSPTGAAIPVVIMKPAVVERSSVLKGTSP